MSTGAMQRLFDALRPFGAEGRAVYDLAQTVAGEIATLRARAEKAEADVSWWRRTTKAREEEIDRLRGLVEGQPCLGEWASGPHCRDLPSGRKWCPTCLASAALRREEE